jgi:predicted Zn-dependent protease
MMRNVMIHGLLVAVLVGLSGCQTLTDVGADIGEASGTLTPEEAAAIRRTGSSVAKSFADITPEQEYYIGRSVAATIFARYAPLNDEGANRYLNILGSVLSQLSKTPETFAGYHFQILDSDEVNAFAAPGGLILVTRGMLKCCRSEEAISKDATACAPSNRAVSRVRSRFWLLKVRNIWEVRILLR